MARTYTLTATIQSYGSSTYNGGYTLYGAGRVGRYSNKYYRLRLNFAGFPASIPRANITSATLTINPSAHDAGGSVRWYAAMAWATSGYVQNANYAVSEKIAASAWTAAKSFTVTNILKGLDWTGGLIFYSEEPAYNTMNFTVGSATLTIVTNEVEISFDQQGGQGGAEAFYGIPSTSLPDVSVPTRTGYLFGGYYTEASGSGTCYYNAAGVAQAVCPSANVTLYAHWTANTYAVSYDANGGTGAPGQQTKTYDVSLTLSSNIPTRTGYTFLGWATSASGAVAYAAGGTYTANAAITLYAVWRVSSIIRVQTADGLQTGSVYVRTADGMALGIVYVMMADGLKQTE